MIQIVDNFLEEGLLKYVQWSLPRLTYVLHKSVMSNTPSIFKSEGEYINDQVFTYIGEHIRTLPFLYVNDIIRSYSNLYTAGSYGAGNFHYDDGRITALFYPYDWSSEYGGETEFEDGTLIEYKKNRIVFFDAGMKHRAKEHKNDVNYRYTVAYKMDAQWVQYEDCSNY
jgi:hypothetical protein